MTLEDVLEVGAEHVFVSTGSHWTVDGVGRARDLPFAVEAQGVVVSADAVLAGDETPSGHVVIFDDDHYYLGPVIALALRARGNAVTLVTPAGRAGQWSGYTNEQYASVRAMLDAGIEIVTNMVVDRVAPERVTVSCIFSGRQREIGADWVLPLTRREPHDALYSEIQCRDRARPHPNTRDGHSDRRLSRAGHHRRRRLRRLSGGPGDEPLNRSHGRMSGSPVVAENW